VEENILKKANQKKLLGDIAIEGGAFTTEFFKKASLRELFKVDRVAMDTAGEEESAQLSQKQIEELLANAEDDTDVQAARRARAEETAEMAEFDETFSSQTTATGEASAAVSGAESQVQSEFALLHEQLSGVEQYAMRYLEAERAHITSQELRLAEENIELAKKDWELTHLQSLRAEEERLAEEEAEDVLLTYDRPETANKVILRRRPSTGTWEILSRPPSISLTPVDCGSRQREKSRANKCSSRESMPQRGQPRRAEECGASSSVADGSSVSAVTDGLEPSAEHLGVDVNEQGSPHLLANHDGDGSHSHVVEAAMSNGSEGTWRDTEEGEERASVSEGTRTNGVEETVVVPSENSSLTLQPEVERERVNSISPGVSIKSEPNFPSTPSKNPPVSPCSTNHTPDSTCISSRTRLRTSHSTSDLDQSPQHKYPTRHKLQHTASIS
jgi:hypothetical protein